ncbi:MAG: hypothetical protein K6G26_13800 [Lachnospiraceae bacterium]|nr:hypothetical protein [Lachnospiraceae bacterium]
MDFKNITNFCKRIIDNLKDNMKIVFLGGVFGALLFASYIIVMTGMVRYKYTMVYQATINTFPHFKEDAESNIVTEDELEKIVCGEQFCIDMEKYIDNYEDGTRYINNIDISVLNNEITINYCAESSSNAKNIVSVIYDKLESSLQKQGNVTHLENIGDVNIQKVKKRMDSNLSIGITQAVELGMLIGMFVVCVCVTIGYLCKFNIINEADVNKNFGIPVLAEIPHIIETEDAE